MGDRPDHHHRSRSPGETRLPVRQHPEFLRVLPECRRYRDFVHGTQHHPALVLLVRFRHREPISRIQRKRRAEGLPKRKCGGDPVDLDFPLTKYVNTSDKIWGLGYADMDRVEITSSIPIAVPIAITGNEGQDRHVFFKGRKNEGFPGVSRYLHPPHRQGDVDDLDHRVQRAGIQRHSTLPVGRHRSSRGDGTNLHRPRQRFAHGLDPGRDLS
ncbi:MAG: hypothetical protein MZV64_30480 [Ignavibacteriales bacterium]|nr:hypothetical protein [Ignavibacteriales bacterium]